MMRSTQQYRTTRATPLEELKAQAVALQTAIGSGLRSIETPELGRVEYANMDQLILALNLINGQIAALEGKGGRTQPVIPSRGLWPAGGACGCSEVRTFSGGKR